MPDLKTNFTPPSPLPSPLSQEANCEKVLESPSPPKVVRKARKPRVPLPKQPPIAIRSLWAWATPTEKEQAHRLASAVMEYWMGQSSKQEIATRLDLPMVRVWQLSQQALAGMVVGLLHPPKDRVSVSPEENPKKLKARIEALEKQVSMQSRLIVILREMPASREALLIREELVLESEQESARMAAATAAIEKNAPPTARKAQLLRKT